MANHRQKKKKSAAAAKQAATAYKGKNAPIKPAVAKQPQEKPEQPKQEVKKPEPPKAEPKKPEAQKPEKPKQEIKKQEPKKVEKKKPEPKKNESKKDGSKKASKNKAKKNAPKTLKQARAVFAAKIAAVVLAISVVVASVCIVMWFQSNEFEVPAEAVPEYKGRNISDTDTLPVLTDLADQVDYANKMKREGDTDAFLYYAADELVFPERNSQAELNLVNVTSNNCVLIASIVDEAGNVCYRSNGLLPSRMLTNISIDSKPYGRHEMKLVVAAYKTDEPYELIGVQYSDLIVQVGIEEETVNGK